MSPRGKAHKSIPVNPLLARAMYLKGYIEKTGTGTEDMIAKCADWGIAAPEWIEDDDDFRVLIRRQAPLTQGSTTQQTTRQTTQDGLEGRRNRGNRGSREKNGRNPCKTNVLSAQDRQDDQAGSRDGRERQTTQQTTQQNILKLLHIGNMRNIVSLVLFNPEINIPGMAHILGLSQDGIKYHIKQIRKRIVFTHVGPSKTGHWEIGPKEPPP